MFVILVNYMLIAFSGSPGTSLSFSNTISLTEFSALLLKVELMVFQNFLLTEIFLAFVLFKI